jgi:cytoskeletal protein CcmA (bactofilin family)
MAIFKKSDDNDGQNKASAPRTGEERPVRSKNVLVLGSTLVIKGELSAAEDLIIEGRIEGTIAHHKKHLTVGEQGRVKADIHASSVNVLGKLIGNIHSEGMVSLGKNAHVNGDIVCSRLVVDEGARFVGNVDMGESLKVPVPKETVPAEPAQAEPVRTEKPSKVAGQTAKASVY